MNFQFFARVVSAQPLLVELAFAASVMLLLAAVVQCCVWSRVARTPRTVSLLWLTVLLAPVAVLVPVDSPPLFTLRVPAESAPAVHTTVIEEVAATTSAMQPAIMRIEEAHAAQTTSEVFAQALLLFWLAGIAWCTTRHAVARIRLERVIADGAPAPARLLIGVRDVAAEYGLRKPPRLIVCDVDAPCVARALRPVVLLPRWMSDTPAHSETLEWMLRHECMHVRLRDPGANAARNLSEALFWFHPLARWAGRKWEAAAERACDAALVDTSNAARNYAHALYRLLDSLSQRSAPQHAYTLGASRTQVGERIRALLIRQDFTLRPQRFRLHVGIAVVLATAVVVGVRCENAPARAEPSSQDWNLRLGDTELEITDDISVWYLKAEGDFRFGPQRRGLEALSQDAYMRLSERGPAGATTLDIEADGGNLPVYDYRVDGETATFDDAGRDWMRDTLNKVGLKER